MCSFCILNSLIGFTIALPSNSAYCSVRANGSYDLSTHVCFGHSVSVATVVYVCITYPVVASELWFPYVSSYYVSLYAAVIRLLFDSCLSNITSFCVSLIIHCLSIVFIIISLSPSTA